MRPIEEYVKQADTLAQDVMNTWCSFTMAGHNDDLTADFKEVFEVTYDFRQAVRMVDNWRGAGTPTATADAEVKQKRLAFAQAFKTFHEKHEA
jgi:hypothetical protein